MNELSDYVFHPFSIFLIRNLFADFLSASGVVTLKSGELVTNDDVSCIGWLDLSVFVFADDLVFAFDDIAIRFVEIHDDV